MAAEVGKLEELALKRKERLRALRDKQKDGKKDVADTSSEAQSALPKPVFRSYQPLDDSLKEHQLPQVKPIAVIDKVQDQLEAAKPGPLVEEVDLMTLAPMKPDWDLKRDIAKKLEKLERRTQRAIAEIIRERILAEKDLAAVATWVASEGQTVGSKSSVMGPQLPSNSDKFKSATAETAFDDDSD